MEDSDGNTLSHNFRPVQPIGDRVVWFTSDKIPADDEDLHTEIHGKKKKKKKKAFWEKSSAQMIETDVVICCALYTFQLALAMKLVA